MRWLVLAVMACAAFVLAPAAQAATITEDFETAPPPIGSPVNDEDKASKFTFWVRSDPGFRPYRRVAGVATHSGTVAADIGPDHCYPDESDEPCEFPVSGTQANITRTPTTITLYAGLFQAATSPVTATLTAYRADTSVAATTTAPIDVGITTPLSVTSGAPDIVRWSLTADVSGAELGFDDLT